MIEFLAGAVTLAYFIAGLYFLRFWRKTHDRLFLNFALAFWLLATNQAIVSLLGTADERSGYAYILRVLGFVLILFAIVDKNLFTWRRRK
jgi:hypothetical protein